MVILAETVPEVVLLAQQVRRAKIAAERADADAAQALSEAAAARARYEKLDADYRAVKTGAAA